MAIVRSRWARSPQKGEKLCSGGSFSGELCDWTVARSRIEVQIKGKRWWRNIVESAKKTGKCVRPGDSGGPIYTVYSDGTVSAMGIINGREGGGGDYWGGKFDKCRIYFTDSREAYVSLPGYLRTN